MPLYEYVCDECGAEFEVMLRLSAADLSPACPKCDSPYVIKKISRVGVTGTLSSGASFAGGDNCGAGSGFS